MEILSCPKSKKLILLCDECFSIWFDPKIMDIEELDLPYLDDDRFGLPENPGDVFIEQLGCSLNQTREATEEEIIGYGWGEYIGKKI